MNAWFYIALSYGISAIFFAFMLVHIGQKRRLLLALTKLVAQNKEQDHEK